MAEGGKERGRVNLDQARVDRARGLSISRIARKQAVTESAIYYALNKHKRRTETPLGKRRSVYVSEALWEPLVARAERIGQSISATLTMVLRGEQPLPLAMRDADPGLPPLRNDGGT